MFREKDLLEAILSQIKEDTAIWRSPIHGIDHWDRVLKNGLRIGAANGADLDVVRYFAYLHDCQRLNEDEDPEHGPRAAIYAERHRNLIDLTNDQMELLKSACIDHTYAMPDPESEVDPTLAACWDGDRLDIGRVGLEVNPFYLFSEAAVMEIEQGVFR